MALIEVKNITKDYTDDETVTKVLHGVSFDINAGEFVAIMGPSGSGKSTILHILGFLDRPTTGEYIFNGRAFDDYTDEQLAKIRNGEVGFVFQSFNLLPRVSVLDNVILPLQYSGLPSAEWAPRATAALDQMGLSHRLNFQPAQLSGGERQRVAIARALVMNPKVIFADEPTGNLDSKSGQVIMEILQKLNREHKHTIILITHETVTAEHAQRIIHVRDGLIESDYKVTAQQQASEYKK
jgi:putative ABC transport system ATP-binding protein